MNREHYILRYMQEALSGLHQSEGDEVPVCCLIVLHDQVIGFGQNETRKSNDVSSHAEIIALKKAADYLHNWRLNEADLFVTMEPCMMCMGAIRLARIRALYYGLPNLVTGIFTVYKQISIQDFPEIHIQGGILEQPIREKMRSFFQNKRG